MQRFGLATKVQHTTAAPRIDVLAAVRRHWLVALAPVVLLVAAAVVLGLKRPVTYTTTATLSVGHVYESNAAGIPTIIEATQSLASVYSRAISSTEVVQDARRRLRREHASPVSGGLSATPIPQSPLIKVSATSRSEPGAIALANAGAAALAAYINRQVRDNNAVDDDRRALPASRCDLPAEARDQQAARAPIYERPDARQQGRSRARRCRRRHRTTAP